ncbi:helix-hairpin-helix domain-containing protein [Cytobacillus kochii]|uniref:helix-hairpin-helix domain-containing protein n=1 Tax=Cytobacillus kochii TaxID=859143 RepID=UPI00203AECB9|nr:helix-hairpin-helix domain-containing protein [Cytobacillus kochii]MCM3324606.1 helix-hairpin-helix domain-containing protein [Cytobacillus kochii]MCM3346999.1 helix-hairpin-helix domain-containing protein [Cytobacillus kochii]
MEWVKQYALYILIVAGFIVGAVCMWLLSPLLNQNNTVEVENEWLLDDKGFEEGGETSQEEEENYSDDDVMVDIKGEVKDPGVYALKSTQRIVDAIQVAGGFLSEADQKQVNLAQKLTDEMVIYIPKVGEEGVSSLPPLNDGNDGKINLNQATVEQLETLPGIGPSKAEDILSYREEVGSFKAIEDLKEVSGIGEKTFEKLKELISVD